MKVKALIILFFVLVSGLFCFAQGTWTQKANCPLAPRYYPNGFSAGGKGYFIFGASHGVPSTKDLAEYNPATNTWAQKTPFPGHAMVQSHTFVIENIAYIVSGAYWSGSPLDYTCYKDVWKYNPSTDVWTQLGDFPGTARHAGFAFTCRGKGYIGIGFDENNNFLYDFWEYNPATDTWTQKANFPGTGRKSGMQFSIADFGYVGMGLTTSSSQLKDIWQYDAMNNTWTQKNDFPTNGLSWESFFAMNGKGYVVTGRKVDLGTNSKEVWEYDPINDTWTGLQAFPGTARYAAVGFAINGKGYTGVGYSTTYNNDFYEYTPQDYGVEQSDGKLNEDLFIFPNPSSTDVNISVVNPQNKDLTLLVFDVNGKCIRKIKLDKNSRIITAEHSLFSAGIYYVALSFHDKSIVKKLIVE